MASSAACLSGKTWLALELAFAVASGLPCLGSFPVPQRGHVILYAAEDSAVAIKKRVCAIASARGVKDIERLAIGLITGPNIMLDVKEHQERLSDTIEKLRPRLLVLDPLIRLHRSDENCASEFASLLAFLRQLQRQHAVAIVLVHHIRKLSADQPGVALRGSSDLHAWSDSNLYLLRQKNQLRLVAEHRALPSPEPVTLELNADPQPHLNLIPTTGVNEQRQDDSLKGRILAVLAEGPLSKTALRERLAVGNDRLNEAITFLEKSGYLQRQKNLLGLKVAQS